MSCCRVAYTLVWIVMSGVLLLWPAKGLSREPAEAARGGQPHWAFQLVQRPALPPVHDPSWIRTPIDAFILARLDREGFKPAPPADRRTLLRRVYLDLIGLPPTPQEQQAFLADRSPDAYRRVVDDLLSRPQYGERWARHWLDVVRYAETNGYERDGAKPSAWRYRDYVIAALNADKPYDRFVTEQLAGDEMPGANAETHIATTFLRLGTWDDEPAEPLVDRYEQLDDVLGTTATAFLGVTLRCARCHDHKFEPFAQVDYYRMLAVFEPLRRPQLGRADLDRPVGAEGELAAYYDRKEKADAAADALQTQLESLNKTIRARLFGAAADVQRLGLPSEAVAAFQAEASTRSRQQKELVKKFDDRLDQEVRKTSTSLEAAQRDAWEKQLAAVNASRPRELPRAYVFYEDGPKAPATHVFRRGDPHKAGKEAAPGLPAVLIREQPISPQALAKSTGRRLWLARWLTRSDNPLVARVMVNRLWQHHFGRGLVGTPNDFGRMGDPPSHPELVDWLAAELVASGWRLKPLHRLMVLSSAYQASAGGPPAGPRSELHKTLLGSRRQRRLDAEAVRDAILAVSGQLNPQMAGPSVYPPLPRAVLEGQSRPGEGWGKSDERQSARRSIYLFVKRVLPIPELELLDAPDTASSCEQRPVSTTAPQALTFLNGDFIRQQARHFAARLERESGPDPEAQVRPAFELALCRPPRPEELRVAVRFMASYRGRLEAEARGKDPADAPQKSLEAFCLVILNTNEFVYLD